MPVVRGGDLLYFSGCNLLIGVCGLQRGHLLGCDRYILLELPRGILPAQRGCTIVPRLPPRLLLFVDRPLVTCHVRRWSVLGCCGRGVRGLCRWSPSVRSWLCELLGLSNGHVFRSFVDLLLELCRRIVRAGRSIHRMLIVRYRILPVEHGGIEMLSMPRWQHL